MAGKFWSWLFDLDDSKSNTEQENRTENVPQVTTTQASSVVGTTLQDAENFIAELQSYYYNDLQKMRTDLLTQTLSDSDENFINKKIKQDSVVLSQIDEILASVRETQREYHAIWGKSIYSFYSEIEKAKIKIVQEKVYKIIIRLCEVNTKQELENIIISRIEKYKEDWNISEDIKLPKNYNAVLIESNNGIEKYRFGNFYKLVKEGSNDKVLTSKQLKQIREISFEFEDRIPTNNVWVYVADATRLQLNFMRRTCIINKTWEYKSEDDRDLYFDVVSLEDLEQYLKGILQIVLSKKTYAIISIVIPTNEMLRFIGQIEQLGDKVKICRKYRFTLQERSGVYGNNLLTLRVDRRHIHKKLKFLSYLQFRKLYF